MSLCFFLLFLLSALFFTPVFIVSSITDWDHGDLEIFELIARIFGYVFVGAIEAFSAISAFYIFKGEFKIKFDKAAVMTTFIMVIILCIHDVLLYVSYGNELEGTFSMKSFFVMDAILLFGYGFVVITWHRVKTVFPYKWVTVVIVIAWIAYMFADMAGYPASQLTDWDEAMMEFVPMCSTIFIGLTEFMKSKKNAVDR